MNDKKCKKCQSYREINFDDHFVCVSGSGPEIYHDDCDACEDFKLTVEKQEDTDIGHSCSECVKVNWDLCGGVRLDEGRHKCGVFEPNINLKADPLQARHFHLWSRETGKYSGTTSTFTGDSPVAKHYDFEEYKPPKRPDPDGWYVVKHEGASPIFLCRKKGDDAVYLDGQVSDCKWHEYNVLARVPEVDWFDDRSGK